MKWSKNKLVVTLVVLLAVGFASVSTTLILNGTIGIASNESDFSIIFTDAKLNNVDRKDFIEPSKKQSLTFATDKLTTVDEEAVLDYEVTNTSKLYDADVKIVCNMVDDNEEIIENNEYITINYQPNSMMVEAGKKEIGSITARLIKASTEDGQVKIKCTLNANAKERDTLPDDLPFDFVEGDGTNVGDELCLGEECFYVVSNNGYTMKLLAKYNLYVGGTSETGSYVEYGDEATGLQDSRMKGAMKGEPSRGTMAFSNSYGSYETSLVKEVVDEYTDYINERYGIKAIGGLLTVEDITSIMGKNLEYGDDLSASSLNKSWLYDRSYWMEESSGSNINMVSAVGSYYANTNYSNNGSFGVRPLLTIKYKKCEGMCTVTGDGTNIGDEVCLGEECFYVIADNGYEKRLLAKYNLYVGSGNENGPYQEYGEKATKRQSSKMRGTNRSGVVTGVLAFSNTSSSYFESTVKKIVDEYTNYINTSNNISTKGGLLTSSDLNNLAGSSVEANSNLSTIIPDKPWLYNRSYWMDGASDTYVDIIVASGSQYTKADYRTSNAFGVRPVLTIQYKKCEGLCYLKGDGTNVGDEICLDDECFYVIENDGKEMQLLAKYNLYVGNNNRTGILTEIVSNEPGYGLQSEEAMGKISVYDSSDFEFIGVTDYSSWAGNYSGSTVEKYVDDYAKLLSKKHNLNITGSLLTMEQINKVSSTTISRETPLNKISTVPSWIYSSSYWTKTFAPRTYGYPVATSNLLGVIQGGTENTTYGYSEKNYLGVRPVITIPLKEKIKICNSGWCYIDDNEDGKASVGEEIIIGTEIFYVISNDDKKIRALAKNNLEVDENSSKNILQNSEYKAKGYKNSEGEFVYSVYNTEYGGSNADTYVENYVNYLNQKYDVSLKGDIISLEELQSLNNMIVNPQYSANGDLYFESVGPDYLYSSSYWTKSIKDPWNMWVVNYSQYGDIKASPTIQFYSSGYGVRPVIEIELENTCKGNVCYEDTDRSNTINMGDEICIGTECFYVMSTTNDKVQMLAKYNLNLGYYSTDGRNFNLIENPTGIQDKKMKGINPTSASGSINGTVRYHDELKNTDVYYESSYVKMYVDEYTSYMNNHYHINATGDTMTLNDLAKMAGLSSITSGGLYEDSPTKVAVLPHWVYGTSYWLKTKSTQDIPHTIRTLGIISQEVHLRNDSLGVRPVLTISKELIS